MYFMYLSTKKNILGTVNVYDKANICMLSPISKGKEHMRLIIKIPNFFSKTGLVKNE